MTSDPSASASTSTAERRPAVWPWLLLPLVALTMFFALRTVKEAPERHAAHTDTAADAAPDEASGSR
jgi:hypothetical protein